jgi:nitronate monooxygenase
VALTDLCLRDEREPIGAAVRALGDTFAKAFVQKDAELRASLFAENETFVTHREAILSGKTSRTSLTRGFTGRLARGIHNQLLEEMNRPDVAVLTYPLQRALMRNLAVPAQQAGRSEFLALWAGQSAGIAQYPDVATLLQSLVKGVSEKLA